MESLRARAACAWEKVQAIKHGDAQIEEEYKALAKRFPALIHNSGLCQAVAFAFSKPEGEDRKGAHRRYLDDLASVMGFASGQQLHCRCLEAELGEYLLLTRRAMHAAGWLSRYVQAVLDGPGQG
ncbi:MAG: type III-B CRISPR module-associated protein Cmr5 [Firmicutes bacterium]|nr:type III-B CRISPR module-associated protein Cmr5 [Bacillota bacterium]